MKTPEEEYYYLRNKKSDKFMPGQKKGGNVSKSSLDIICYLPVYIRN
jgi:hypothetical protein